ncbi:MAG TPA: DUF2975 domain-containing protein [Bacteroidetes bacterium]|nr:DUF2975 domain-containing protein [Bacteroidota bacterium]
MKTSVILITMKVIIWVVFIGLCIKAGTVIFSGIISLVVNPTASEIPYFGLSLSGLLKLSSVHYVILWGIISAIMILKADIFYKLIQLFSNLDLNQPFNQKASDIITKISYLTVAIGVLSAIGSGYGQYLSEFHITVNYGWGTTEYLFMAGVIFVIAQVFKRGIEFQSDNELTI